MSRTTPPDAGIFATLQRKEIEDALAAEKLIAARPHWRFVGDRYRRDRRRPGRYQPHAPLDTGDLAAYGTVYSGDVAPPPQAAEPGQLSACSARGTLARQAEHSMIEVERGGTPAGTYCTQAETP